MIDTKELRRLAQAAKDSCESAEWTHEFREGRFSEGRISSGEETIIILCGANYGCWRDADDDGDSQFKALGDFVAAANPAAISELLDRLEAWENVFGHLGTPDEVGNEWHALSDRLEAAEKERDELRAEVQTWQEQAKAYWSKIEQMEKQEPVAWTTKLALEYGASRLGFQVSGVNIWGENGVPLYTSPGAQGDEK